MEENITKLKRCPDCGLPVSKRAISCPHCGCPFRPIDPKEMCIRTKPKKREHMRLPNGFGQITYIKNRTLRNPYRAMVTVGKTDTGRPICKILKPQGYFHTYNEAYEALMKYNSNPYDLSEVITVKELYFRWYDQYSQNITDSSKRTIKAAWSYCENLYNVQIRNLNVGMIKDIIAECPKPSIKARIKSVFNLMLDYAVEHGLLDKNPARDFKVEKVKVVNEHHAFTKEELDLLWKYQSIPFICIVLIQCYTGFRPRELCELRIENINLQEKTIIGGMKTEAGTNRVVPICSKIMPVIKKIYGLEKIRNDGKFINYTYDEYYKQFMLALSDIGIVSKHTPHDPRKQFITMCKETNVNEYAIKRAVGHAIDDITEKIYTERDPKWLSNEIEKISKYNSPEGGI